MSTDEHELTVGELVDALPADGTPVRVEGLLVSYQGTYSYNDGDWKSVSD